MFTFERGDHLPKDGTISRDKIIQAARKEFSEKGYKKASMRTIAANSGLVVGALYRHFKDKEVLFEYFVSPVFMAAEKLMKADGEKAHYNLNKSTLEEIWEVSEEFIQKCVNFVFQYKEELRLLLYCSHGSRYEYFIDDYAIRDMEGTIEFFAKVQEKGFTIREVMKEDMLLLIKNNYRAILEVIIQSSTIEQAEDRMRNLMIFYNAGWKALIKFNY